MSSWHVWNPNDQYAGAEEASLAYMVTHCLKNKQVNLFITLQ